MTNEEARDRLDIIITKHEVDDENVTITKERDYEAMREAIKALEQQTCEDAVSREVVIEWLKHKDIIKLKSQEERARKELQELPSVQPETTVYEDAVSRQAVLDIFADNADAVRPYSKTWEEVKTLPPVNPQRTGHWIQTEEKNEAEPCILWECSCCHKEFRSIVHKVSNYCPSCGCRIVEPQESEE